MTAASPHTPPGTSPEEASAAAAEAAAGGAAPTEAARDAVARMRRADRVRLGAAAVGLGTVLLVLLALRVLWGHYQVTPADFVRILAGQTIPGASFIVLEEKLPRAVAAVLAGGALGAAGALYRRTLRNPLASPDILGVTTGAAAAVAAWLALTAGQVGGGSDLARSGAALVGALAAGAAVFLAARSIGGERFIVAGIAVAAAGQALVAGTMLSLSEHDLQAATLWIAGSLNGVTWGRIALLGAVTAVLLPAAGLLHRALAPADLGLPTAAALGARPQRTGAAALVLGAVLAAAATAAVGPLAFVALLAGPAAQGLTGGRPSLACSALTGAAMVVLADLLAAEAAALLFDGARLPTGVLTGAAGAPLMLWMLLRQGRERGGRA